MLAQTEGDLWHQVEPLAKERPGWVAFLPRPEPMAMRALVPTSYQFLKLGRHICTAAHAHAILSAALPVSAALATYGSDRTAKAKANVASRDLIVLTGELNRGAAITTRQVARVVELARRIDQLASVDAATDKNVAVADATVGFYESVRVSLARPPCGPGLVGRRLKWWLIPLLLIGTALVVHSEAKDPKR
jgi:hypothetical protein